ncbi:MAG: AAA family ATPase [Gemmataceae bacterium]|nr:AAA family ATPase [Gemmataceae bacterium]
MRISRIEITNFRNFRHLDVTIGMHAVIVGENKIGKSNLLFALQLILDPSLPDSERCLRLEDFWDGLERPLNQNDRIEVSVELSDFDDNNDHLALVGEFLIQPDPMVARLTYVYQPVPNLPDGPKKESDYEFAIYGGGRPECRVGYELRKKLPMNMLPALRDAVSDLANWRKSPLRPLLDKIAGEMDRDRLNELAEGVSKATATIAGSDEVRSVGDLISQRLLEMVGSLHALEMSLGFLPSDAERLIRSLRLFIDGGERTVADASLGSANLLYLALKALQLDQQVSECERSHTFLAIEEPEAHLHPHVQRRVYRAFLRPRQAVPNGEAGPGKPSPEMTILLTTHSPSIVSVSPVHSLVLLRKTADLTSTLGVSTAKLELDAAEADDIERYLDVTRGEMLFAKGVLLVEGEAEQYMLPVLAELNGYNLDELGITVCSVAGTHFLPYLKFLGPTGLNIPYAVITDADPNVQITGLSRIRQLLEFLAPDDLEELADEDEIIDLGKRHGIFLTEDTFEVALFRGGRHASFATTMGELSSNAAAKTRATSWKANPTTLDVDKMLKDINAIGKGRFSQRWALRISRSKSKSCPTSVSEALKHVTSRIQVQALPESSDGTSEEP